MVIKRVEQYAREKGYSEITPDIMRGSKGENGSRQESHVPVYESA